MALDLIKSAISGASHLHTLMYFVSDAFSSGKSWQKGDDPTAAYKKMLDEAIGINTYRLLRQKLEAEGLDVDQLYQETAKYFQENPFYVDAWRESLAAVSDAAARVEMLREFVLADEAEKHLLCQQIDQRHPWARAIYDHLVRAQAVWDRLLGHELSLNQARQARAFLASLPYFQRHQFQYAIGGLSSADDRVSCLGEVLARHPDLIRMREVALSRGLIKKPGQTQQAIKNLATPRPNDPAETAIAQAGFNVARQQLRQTLSRNPLARLFR